MMGAVFGVFYANNGTLEVFYTNSMDYCPQDEMVNGISYHIGSVALVRYLRTKNLLLQA